MGSTFIPTREAELDAWLNNFQSLVAAGPSSYGLSAGDAAAIAASYAAWHAAYLGAVSPATRTVAAVSTKNQQKRAAVALVRQFAGVVRADPAVSGALKIGLGLRIRDEKPTAIPAPASFPLLTVTEPLRGMQGLRAADQRTPTRRAKPAGAASLLLFRHIGDGPVADPALCTFLAVATRTEYTAHFDAADNGRTATYFARWANFRGEVGPWSPGVSVPIAA